MKNYNPQVGCLLLMARRPKPLCHKLRWPGLPPHSFGLHSLQVGKAMAAENKDSLFKRHKSAGNPKGPKMEDSLEKRLKVSRRLGL